MFGREMANRCLTERQEQELELVLLVPAVTTLKNGLLPDNFDP